MSQWQPSRSLQRKKEALSLNSVIEASSSPMDKEDICVIVKDLKTLTGDDDEFYFEWYSSVHLHYTMLKDKTRTLTYRDAMYENSDQFKGKVVLDVGCGTGILSLFAAKAGAARVIGIEASDIGIHAERIVKDNQLDHIITIVKARVGTCAHRAGQAKVEDVVRLPHDIEKVDIIVSEWMGYCLLYESMWDTVIYARDKWLKKDGILLPDKCSLFITAFEDEETKQSRIDFWNNVANEFDMSNIGKQSLHQGREQFVEPKNLVAKPVRIRKFNMQKVKKGDLSFDVPYKLVGTRPAYVDGLVVYFDVEFSKFPIKKVLSTGPHDPKTHWKQSVFYFEKLFSCQKGEIITGTFGMKQNPREKRDIDVSVTLNFKGVDGTVQESNVYHLS